jgi:hypothetical protein
VANVLNRTTKQYIASANTVEYPVVSWIINPDLSAVIGFDSKYWTITGDVVSLLSQAERDALDAAALGAARDARANRLDQVEDIARAAILVIMDEFNLHSARINAMLTAIDSGNTLAQVKTNIAAIQDIPVRTIAQLKTALRGKLGT